MPTDHMFHTPGASAHDVAVAALTNDEQPHNEIQEPRVGMVGYAGDDSSDGTGDVETAAAAAPATMDPTICTTITTAASMDDKKKRLCRFPGCNRVIKSQGHCQRHGAKAKRCRYSGCDKQAQGTHDGLCKRHWKAVHFPDTPEPPHAPQPPPAPTGESVYEHVLPLSIAFRPSAVHTTASTIDASGTNVNRYKEADSHTLHHNVHTAHTTDDLLLDTMDDAFHMDATAATALYDSGLPPPPVAALPVPPLPRQTTALLDPWDAPPAPEGVVVMPLVQFLAHHAHKKAGWHRHQERRARGVFPVSSLSCQLEPWERQLALVEILLLSGGTPYANFKHLSHAWGREKGFHTVLANSVCERRGEVERKRRSDAGKVMTPEERLAFREKLQRSRVTLVAATAAAAHLEPIDTGTRPHTNHEMAPGHVPTGEETME